jgi:hypothetical protein
LGKNLFNLFLGDLIFLFEIFLKIASSGLGRCKVLGAFLSMLEYLLKHTLIILYLKPTSILFEASLNMEGMFSVKHAHQMFGKENKCDALVDPLIRSSIEVKLKASVKSNVLSIVSLK